MKKYLFLISLLVCFSSNSFAQSLKIGYIDLQQVIRNSKAGKTAKTSFEKEFKSKRDIIESKNRSLDKMKQDFIKNAPVMNETTRKQKADQIERMEKELNRTREDFRTELQKRDLELTQKILKDIEGILKNIGDSEGYSIIFEKTEAGIVYAGDGVDVTNKVIQSYDSK